MLSTCFFAFSVIDLSLYFINHWSGIFFITTFPPHRQITSSDKSLIFPARFWFNKSAPKFSLTSLIFKPAYLPQISFKTPLLNSLRYISVVACSSFSISF